MNKPLPLVLALSLLAPDADAARAVSIPVTAPSFAALGAPFPAADGLGSAEPLSLADPLSPAPRDTARTSRRLQTAFDLSRERTDGVAAVLPLTAPLGAAPHPKRPRRPASVWIGGLGLGFGGSRPPGGDPRLLLRLFLGVAACMAGLRAYLASQSGLGFGGASRTAGGGAGGLR